MGARRGTPRARSAGASSSVREVRARLLGGGPVEGAWWARPAPRSERAWEQSARPAGAGRGSSGGVVCPAGRARAVRGRWPVGGVAVGVVSAGAEPRSERRWGPRKAAGERRGLRSAVVGSTAQRGTRHDWARRRGAGGRLAWWGGLVVRRPAAWLVRVGCVRSLARGAGLTSSGLRLGWDRGFVGRCGASLPVGWFLGGAVKWRGRRLDVGRSGGGRRGGAVKRRGGLVRWAEGERAESSSRPGRGAFLGSVNCAET